MRTLIISALLFLLAFSLAGQETARKYYFELTGGVNIPFAGLAFEPFEQGGLETSIRPGYLFQLNSYLRVSRANRKLGDYFFFGFGKGRASARFEGLTIISTPRESNSAAGMEIKRQESVLEMDQTFWGLSMGFKFNLTPSIGLLGGPQFRFPAEGQMSYQHQIITSQFYDAGRGVFIPLPAPIVTETSEVAKRRNYLSILMGIEYRTLSDRLTAKVILSFDGKERDFPINTYSLQLLLGYRLWPLR